MSAENGGASLDWNDLAWRSLARNRTFMLPDVVSQRLDQLVQTMDEAGGRATRAEIVAALLCARQPDPSELEQLLKAYKRATNADVYLGEARGPGLVLEPPHPGPRARL